MKIGDKFKNLFSHPFILLILGAIISSIVIPQYTNQWQNYQKEIELKTNLANDINKAISEVTTSAQLVNNPAYVNITNLGSTYKNWEISKTITTSEIATYFTDNHLIQNWNNLSSVVSRFIGIAAMLPGEKNQFYNYYLCFRLSHIIVIQKYYSNYPLNLNSNFSQCKNYYIPDLDLEYINKHHQTSYKGMNWTALLYKGSPNTSYTYPESYHFLTGLINTHKNNVLESILKSKSSILN